MSLDKDGLVRKRVPISQEQNELLKQRAKSENLPQYQLLQKIFDAGFEAYFGLGSQAENSQKNQLENGVEEVAKSINSQQDTKDSTEADSTVLETQKLDKILANIDELLFYSKQAAGYAAGAVAGYWYREVDSVKAQEVLVKNARAKYDNNWFRSRVIAGSNTLSMTFLFQKVGEYMVLNGGDYMNALWQFCNKYKVDPRTLLETTLQQWPEYKTPITGRALKSDSNPAFRQFECVKS